VRAREGGRNGSFWRRVAEKGGEKVLMCENLIARVKKSVDPNEEGVLGRERWKKGRSSNTNFFWGFKTGEFGEKRRGK